MIIMQGLTTLSLLETFNIFFPYIITADFLLLVVENIYNSSRGNLKPFFRVLVTGKYGLWCKFFLARVRQYVELNYYQCDPLHNPR